MGKKSHLPTENQLLIYKAEIKPIWSYGMGLWCGTSNSNSHHAEIPIQNSQNHTKCTPACNKSYSTYRLQHHVSDVIHERINKHHNKLEDHLNPLLQLIFLLLLPLALQPTVGFGLPFFPICHQLSPTSHPQHLKISFYFLFPSLPGSSPSSCPFKFLSEELFGHPIHLHSL